jgi:putative PIN family toxin of toxin-antitoxin system
VRAVIDTNVLLAGLLWHGPPHALLQHLEAGTLTLISSPALLAELQDVLSRSKFDATLNRAGMTREQALQRIRRLAEVYEPVPLAVPVCRDPDDDKLLALARSSRAACIVSGDDDLKVLQSFEGIPIHSPAQALTMLGERGQ